MSKSDKDLEIISELAKEIAEETHSAKGQSVESGEVETDHSKSTDMGSLHNDSKENHNTKNKKEKKSARGKRAPTLNDLAIAKKSQNLAERKILLVILAVLLGIQLLFMNLVVLAIVMWSLFDLEWFRDINTDILKSILDFTKYYVTAVLVELLGGIIYIVHRVFSDNN